MAGRMELSHEDKEALRDAKDLLENPSLAAKIAGVIGMPIEKALQQLPEKWAEVVNASSCVGPWPSRSRRPPSTSPSGDS